MAPENAQVRVRGRRSKECFIWSIELKRFSGMTIEKIGSSVKYFCPIYRRLACLKEESTHDFISAADGSFRFTILL